MKKEVGTVCISTTPSSLYVGYPKTTVPIYLVPTHGRSGTLFLLLLYYDELLAIVVRSTVLYCTS